MKTSFALIFIFAVVSQHFAAAQDSLSAEAEERKNSCGELVKPHPKTTTAAAAPASPSSAPQSPAPTGSVPSEVPTLPSLAPTEGQCRWVCEGESSIPGEEGTGSTGEVTAESGATGGEGSGATQPSGSGSTKPGHVDFDCELTDALYNISLILTVEQRTIFLEFIEYIKVTILIDVTLTDIEKVVRCSYALKHFCSQNIDIYYKIAFEFIGSWGRCIDFVYVSVDLQAVITEKIVTLDSNGDCELFEALLNATQGNQQQYEAVLELIEELRVTVFANVELTYAQKLAKCHEIIVAFFEVHVEWQSSFYEIEITGYGSFESYVDVCHGYYRALTIGKVISGSSDSDCVLLAALTEASANTSFSLSVRNQIKELHDKLQAYFVIEIDISIRLQYISQQCFQVFQVEEFIVQVLDLISCEVDGELWGLWYDVLWCSQFCHNSGSCGDLDHGMGTSLAPSTSTSVAGTSAVVTSSAGSTASTEAPTTTSPAADCGSRPTLIVISSVNTTILTDTIIEHYNTWNSSVRLGFNSCLNQVRKAIWDDVDFPTYAVKISNIVQYFLNYNKNNANAQNILMNITVVEWRGTIRQFCNCGQ
ncbi:hypothetical protein Ddc_16291 [Ditylenchus destructor]|nr:hypothetical protein Ddc_16291 [Ditylenchus destructor]